MLESSLAISDELLVAYLEPPENKRHEGKQEGKDGKPPPILGLLETHKKCPRNQCRERDVEAERLQALVSVQ